MLGESYEFFLKRNIGKCEANQRILDLVAATLGLLGLCFALWAVSANHS